MRDQEFPLLANGNHNMDQEKLEPPRTRLGALWRRLPSSPAVRNALSATVEFLKPEFLQRKKAAAPRKGNTAWLDGLRGGAALTVCIMHLTVYTHTDMELCYGDRLPNGQLNTSPAALPILRIPFTGGHYSVMLFFVISGYVVPRRLITLLHEGRKDDFVEAVCSAIVRRPGRLFIPVALSTLFLAVVMGHIIALPVPFPFYKSNIVWELYNWFGDMCLFLFYHRFQLLFTWYNFHTWTIPVELRGSLWLFVWLFATHQMATRSRVLLTCAKLFYLVFWTPGGWYSCFFCGMLTSELDLLAESGQVRLPWDGLRNFFIRRPRLRMFVLHLTLLIGLYLACQPSSDGKPREELLGECYGWKTLNRLIPGSYKDGPPNNTHYRWYYLIWAAWFTVVGVKEIPWVRWIFETNTAQYLGRHSFALYLIHGPMIGIFSERVFYLTGVKSPIDLDSFVKFGHLYNKWHDAPWWPFPDGGYAGLEPNFLFCVALSIPLFLYVAELGTKAFDAPSIKTSNWMYRKMKEVR
ncbi:acyltransferase like [Lecanosticta acicola]|uniref:Acyltransferase like n=1 Tax=Lecanosticta acicola TaxID=111012 RepID=A0AAI8Z2W2_9PEZI|nr:acyltransferase like [Lecanosticta acicola]